MTKGSLWIISTPIGNLKDITLHAIEAIKSCDIILCEDTRVSAKLLNHLGVKKPMFIHHDHSENHQMIIDKISKGAVIALISDAGTPLISDPGFKLVREARMRGLEVFVAPGACSVIAALTLSGLPTDRFYFAGFLSHKAKERENQLEEFSHITGTIIVFERKNRIEATLNVIFKIMGDLEISIVREATKLFQEVICGKISEVLQKLSLNLKGEFVILISNPKKIKNEYNLESDLKKLLENMSLRDASIIIAKNYKKPRKEIYNLGLLALNLNPPKKFKKYPI